MDIFKAIEILTLHWKGHKKDRDPDFYNACYLGVGALQQVAQMRQLGISPIAELLPGETLSATGGDQ